MKQIVLTLGAPNDEVIGIFTGGSREMETAQRIFGRDWIKIQDMNQFSEAVGKILRQKLYERGGV